jgi:transcriptional regulator with XRE-family HTH domain
MARDNLLGEFLQARRARVSPQDAGVVAHGRRRVDGLRRDELARLAGVSVQYLTRLEQGVDRHPSAQVLDALAAALRLDPDATAHLHALAAPAVAHRPAPAGPSADPSAGPGVQQLLDAWGGTPAYVRDRFFDVLTANKGAMRLAPLYHPGRNLVRDMFLEPAARTLFPQWDDIAAQTVAAFRATADLRDPRTAGLVGELSADADFAALWARHDIRPTRDEVKLFDHPEVGRLALRRQSLAVAAASGQVIIAYQPEPGSTSADALARLL